MWSVAVLISDKSSKAHVIDYVESSISEDFEGIDTLTLQVRYDMPIKPEANLWTATILKDSQTAPHPLS